MIFTSLWQGARRERNLQFEFELGLRFAEVHGAERNLRFEFELGLRFAEVPRRAESAVRIRTRPALRQEVPLRWLTSRRGMALHPALSEPGDLGTMWPWN